MFRLNTSTSAGLFLNILIWMNSNLLRMIPLAHRNVVAAYILGDGATFWKLFLALIGSCRQNKYCQQ